MHKTLVLILWAGRALMQLAEVAVGAKHALDGAWGYPWRRPPWGGGGGNFWNRYGGTGG